MGATVIFFGYICFGSAIGSFLAALSHRLLVKEDIFLKPPYCLDCSSNKPRIRSLIPMISFLLQKGRCLECGRKINFRYFAREFVNTVAYVLLFILFGFCLKLVYLSLLFSLLLTIAIVDLEAYEIPVILQMLLYVFVLLHIILTPMEPLYAALRAAIYFIVIEFLKITTEKLAEVEVIGGGDVKLIVTCGFMLNLEYMSIFLLFTGIFGIILGFIWKKNKKWELFPLAPAIVLAFYTLLVHQYARL
jgi:leader peptidase (prepilin peptidase)/N-methyltransferase